MLARKLRPDKVLIVVLDTLATTIINTGSKREYLELTDDVRDNVERYIENETKELKNCDFEIIVAPGVGRFRNGVFKGNLSDFYYFTCWELAKRMVGFYRSLKEVHLDLTHGINFMPTLTYLSLKEIISAFNILRSGENNGIKFTVYNSDPVVGEEMQKLEIHVVEKSEPIWFVPRLKVVESSITPVCPSGKNPELWQKLNSEKEIARLRKILNCKDASAFLGAILNGFPLAIVSFFPENIRCLGEAIEDIVSIFIRYIDVNVKDCSVTLNRKLKFTEHFKFLVFVWIFARLLRLTEVIKCRLKEVELEVLKVLKGKVFKWNNVLYSVVGTEIWQIEEHVKKRNVSDWTLLARVFGRKNDQEKKKSVHDRNFLAHAGLEENCVEVKIGDREEIMVRYCEELMNVIREYCCKGLIEARRS